MRFIKYIILLFVVFIQYGCFEIVEEVSLNTDGSGTFKYTVNFSQSMTKIKALLLLDEVEGYKVPTEEKIKTEFEKLAVLSQGIQGISNVNHSTDFDNYIFIYNCDFQKIENLNAVIDSLSKKSESLNYYNTEYFSYSKSEKIFTRTGDDVLKQLYHKMTESQRQIFYGSQYTALYRFEGEVEKVTEPKAKISANKKAVIHQLQLILLAQRGEAINKKIYLK